MLHPLHPGSEHGRERIDGVATTCAVFAAAVGAMGLVGWGFDIDAVKGIVPGLPQMKALTAVALIALGAGLVLRREGASASSQWLGAGLGVAVAALGAVVSAEYLVGSVGIDEVLVSDPGASSYPGRPAPHTAVAFVAAGMALAAIDRGGPRYRLASTLLAVTTGVVVAALIGYVYDVDYLRSVSTGTGMALNTALALGAVGVGLNVLRPDRGVAGLMRERGPGGTIARRLIPTAILAPVLLGLSRNAGQDLGIFDAKLGLGWVTLVTIALFVLIGDRTARRLTALDTDRQRAEDALRESERTARRLAAIVESSSDAMFSKTLEGIVTSWNRGAEAIYGYSAHDMIGTSVERLMPAGAADQAEQLLGRVAAGETVSQLDVTRVRRDGREIDVSLTISPIRDTEGRVVGASTVARDISERKRSERRMRSLLDAAPDATVVVDADGIVVMANAQVEHTLGYADGELLGRPVEILVPSRFSARHAAHRAAFAATPVPRPMGRARELYARRKDGSEVPVEISLSPLDTEDGRLVIASVRDTTELKRFEAELARHGRYFNLARDLVCTATRDGRFVDLNGRWEETLGWTREELRARPYVEFVHPEDRASTEVETTKLADGGDTLSFRNRYRTRDGGWRWLEWNSVTPPGEDLVYASARDVTSRVELEDALGEAEERFRRAFDDAPIGIALVSSDGRFTRVNSALCAITGYPVRELEVTGLRGVTHPDDVRHTLSAMDRLRIGELLGYAGEQRYIHAGGDVIPVEVTITLLRGNAGTDHEFLLQVHDITERKRFEGQLQHLADHDPLTGLFNRRRFEHELNRELATAARYKTEGVLLALDLDNFKYVNDSLGHAVGDELITRVAGILRDRFRETDVVARLGGDEFAIILPRADEAEAVALSEELLATFRRDGSLEVRGRTYTVRASIGVAPFHDADELTGAELMAEADIAMYDAKEAGRDRVALYDVAEHRHNRMQARLTWAERIRTAIDESRFVLHAQVIRPLGDDTTPRHELLLRMIDDDGDLIPPGTFLYIAERFDLIRDIDRWVLREAIRILAEHRDDEIALQVNLSAKSITDPELPGWIAGELKGHGIDGRGLCIEITETAAIVNVDRAKEFAHRLAALGCEFALDDFGAGFASFYYLKHMQFDYVKIDGEFIKNLGEDITDQLVVQCVVQIARGLGKRTVAEFVEDEATLNLLHDFGVDYAQGYHLSRPVPLSEVNLAGRIKGEPGGATTGDASSPLGAENSAR